MSDRMIYIFKIFFIYCLSFTVFPGYAQTTGKYLFSPKGVAQLHITMLNGKNINDIQHDEGNMDTGEFFRAEKIEARIELKNSDKSTYSATELYSGKILIKGRGNTTWHRPRRPYSIDLITDNGSDNPAPLLGMGKDNEWALITFWEDRSLMRIPMALWLGRQMYAIDFTASFRYVELWIDNDYRGLYILTEKVQRGDSRINVKSLDSSAADQVEPRVNGGYILEVVPRDKMKREDENDTKIDIPGMLDNYHWYVFKYPKPKNITPAQQNYIFKYLTDFNNTLQSANFKDPVNGYAKYINVEAFIDWCILHDLSKGVDNLFHASVFLQKDRDKKLRMTAPWDFDLSFGNVPDGSCYKEDEFWIRKAHYFNRLWEDENFRTILKNRFEELTPLMNSIPYVLQENYNQLEQLGVLKRDFDRYGEEILRTYKNDKQRVDYVNIDTYKGHVRYLTDWFESRKAWLYYNLGETKEDRCERLANMAPTIRVLEPEKLENKKATWTTLMPAGNGKYSYRWFVDDVLKTETETERYQIIGAGSYTVQVVDKETGCKSVPSRAVGWGIDDTYKSPDAPPDPPIQTDAEMPLPDDSDILLFPNPTTGMVYLNEKSDINIYTSQGVLLKKTNGTHVDLSSYPDGIYMLRINNQWKKIILFHF